MVVRYYVRGGPGANSGNPAIIINNFMFKTNTSRVIRDLLLSLAISFACIAFFTMKVNPWHWPCACRPIFFILSLVLFGYLNEGGADKWMERIRSLGKKSQK